MKAFMFSNMVVLEKTYNVSPYDSQRSHPSMDLGVKWDLCILFVQTAVKYLLEQYGEGIEYVNSHIRSVPTGNEQAHYDGQ